MLSLWKVREVDCCGDSFFQVYRTTDSARASERIQTKGEYLPTKKEAETLARRLNTEDAV